MALLAAMILNAVFRIGVRERQILPLSPGADAYQVIRAFFDENGGKWGARRDVVEHAAFGCSQAVEIIVDYCQVRGPITIEAHFDEFSLDVSLAHAGSVLELPAERPSIEDIVENDDSVLRLGGYLLRRIADRVRTARRGDRAIVEFHFQH